MENTNTKSLVTINAPELDAIEKSKAEQIKATFEPMVVMLSEFESQFNEIVSESEKEITKEITEKAKRLRIDIGKVRIGTEKLRKEQKEEYLRAGKAIDGVSNILKWAVADKENKLKEIENHFELKEKEYREKIQSERAELLSKYVEDAHERNLSSMDEDVWNAYFQTKKKAWEDEQAAIKKAEEERIERERLDKLENNRKLEIAPYMQFLTESKDLRNMSDTDYSSLISECKKAKSEYDTEQEKIRIENEKLKKEAEEKEKNRIAEEKARKEREEAERKAREEKERKEREAYEAKLKAEREAREKIEREEKEKREKLEAELRAKQEAERKAKEEEEARIQAELNKGDADKVNDLITELKILKSKFSFSSKKNQKMYSDVGIMLTSIIDFITK